MIAQHRLVLVDRLANNRAEAAALASQFDGSLCDVRGVEQNVDELQQVGDLTIDDGVRVGDSAVTRRELTKDVEAVADRRERIAELVRQRLEERAGKIVSRTVAHT